MYIAATVDNGPQLEVKWDYEWEMAKDILEAIQICGTSNIKRVDGDGFKVYWAGNVLRVDIERAEMIQ
jgi:hypothetical protein